MVLKLVLELIILIVLMMLLLLVLIIPAMVFPPYGGVNVINNDRVGEYSITFNDDKLMKNLDNLLNLSPIDFINLGYYYVVTAFTYSIFVSFSDTSYDAITIRCSRN